MTADETIKGKADTPSPFFRLETIKKRADFKAANGGPRFSTPGFTMLRAPAAATDRLRFGFTVTKKLGKAVLRNRIRRRLKAAVQAMLKAESASLAGQPMDLVILARQAAADLPFETLSRDLGRATLTLAKRGSEAGKRG
ncbi:MAG: ribonuclease P protein component [Proteobacteria bacterium]|nr:ribonuclease P protein component [Pseudomonadota bacterium]